MTLGCEALWGLNSPLLSHASDLLSLSYFALSMPRGSKVTFKWMVDGSKVGVNDLHGWQMSP